MFFFCYRLIGYRRKIIFENLKKSFPSKTEKELLQIQKKFYRNFCDYIVETLKNFTISEKELRVRVQHINQNLFHKAKKEGKNIILLSGHVFNWEWINGLSTIIPQDKCFPVYRKIQNYFWEEKIKIMRSRFKNEALETSQVIRHILKNPNDGNSVYMFISDQTPHISEVNYGLQFLNQKTPAFIGYDKLSTKMDLVFIYCDIKKVKRGFYQINYYEIKPENEQFKPFEVVKKFYTLLEKTIEKNPDNWLWSHRRWKYQETIKNMLTS